MQWLACPLVTRPVGVRFPDPSIIENLALYIRDCVYLCLLDETLKSVGPFYLVSMPGEVKVPTSLCTLEMCNLSWTPPNSLNHFCVSPKMGCLYIHN